MGLFSWKKRKKEEAMKKPIVVSREYLAYMRKERRKRGWYEVLANAAGKIITMEPDEKTKREVETSALFTGMDITAQDVMALAVLTIIIFVGAGVVMIASGLLPLTNGLLILLLGVGLGYYFLKYPANTLKAYRMEASSQTVLLVLYMVISMRVVPNIEQAMRFAASNISGPLAWEMRRLLWDIEMGKYTSAVEALTEYIAKWKPENEEFAEALRLIRDSLFHPPERAEKMLNEALDVILTGTKTRMKHYAQELQTPVMVIHMMGIVLPVLGSIIAPLAAIFLADMARLEYFFVGYDVVLPLTVLWFINSTLKKRPSTFSQVDTSEHPDLPPKGTFYLKGGSKRIAVPVMPISLMVAMIFLLPPIYYFSSNPHMLLPSEEPHSFLSLFMSFLITLGIGFGIGSYFYLSNFQRMGIQSDIQATEGEFELALFQLGNRVAGGVPPELAIEQAVDDVKDLKISGLFKIAIRNIRTLGMTFKEAMFNRKYGAVLYYPSKLIKNIMRMVTDIAEKGIRYASEGMLTVSTYLRNVRETQEYIRELLSETVSSMTFQAYLLTPMVTGLIVSMSEVIIKILSILMQRLAKLSASGSLPINIGGIFGFEGGTVPISPELFQLVIGLYVIEMMIILSIFLTKITYGENKVVQWYNAGKMISFSLIVYLVVATLSSLTFGGMIASAVESVT